MWMGGPNTTNLVCCTVRGRGGHVAARVVTDVVGRDVSAAEVAVGNGRISCGTMFKTSRHRRPCGGQVTEDQRSTATTAFSRNSKVQEGLQARARRTSDNDNDDDH